MLSSLHTTTSNPTCFTSCTPTRRYRSPPYTSELALVCDCIQLTSHSDLVKCFVTTELMRWPGIESIYGSTLRQSPVFASGSQLGKKTGQQAEEKDDGLSAGDHRWEELHKRVIEHVRSSNHEAAPFIVSPPSRSLLLRFIDSR